MQKILTREKCTRVLKKIMHCSLLNNFMINNKFIEWADL